MYENYNNGRIGIESWFCSALHCGEKENDDSLVLGVFALASGQGGASSGGTGSDTGGSSTTTVATPTFSPTPENQTANANITISTTTDGATIYYTTDGSDPTTSSTHYSGSIANIWALAGRTIRPIVVKEGLDNSEILSGVFSLPPLKTGSGPISGYTFVSNEDEEPTESTEATQTMETEP